MKSPKTIAKLLIKDGFKKSEQYPANEEIRKWNFSRRQEILGREGWFLPERRFYAKVLANIESDDVILDVGAGNFALDFLMAEKAKKVYAMEINPIIVKDALDVIGSSLPSNLTLICGNALDFPVPRDVNTIVILMKHFIHNIPKEWIQGKKFISSIGKQFKVMDNRRGRFEP